jgi:inward rectifier potassium channel
MSQDIAPPPGGVAWRKTPIVQRREARYNTSGVRRVGLDTNWRHDLYHRTISLPWYGFLLLGSAMYLGGNVIFALLYMVQPGAILQARPGSFLDAFFFSVQTMATIGYGAMSPATVYANTVVTAETLFGMLLLAMVSGLTFARISIPTARVLFSRSAVISRYDGAPTLMVRLANQRRSHVVQAQVTLSLLRNERSAEGHSMRRFHDLKLARATTPVFALTFTVMHVVTPESPLYGATAESLLRDEVELVISVTGLDGVLFQTIHARASYLADEILFGRRFVDIFKRQPDGGFVINFLDFHQTEPEA